MLYEVESIWKEISLHNQGKIVKFSWRDYEQPRKKNSVRINDVAANIRAKNLPHMNQERERYANLLDVRFAAFCLEPDIT